MPHLKYQQYNFCCWVTPVPTDVVEAWVLVYSSNIKDTLAKTP